MPNPIAVLSAHTGRYTGEGLNHDKQAFHGEPILAAILDGKGLVITFTATGPDGAIYHAEHTTIAPDAAGSVAVWNLNSNSPGLIRHDWQADRPVAGAEHTLTFAFGEPANEGAFR